RGGPGQEPSLGSSCAANFESAGQQAERQRRDDEQDPQGHGTADASRDSGAGQAAGQSDRPRVDSRPAPGAPWRNGAPRGREMNPDVVGAIARLRADGVLSSAQAARFDRVARRRLVSLRFEIRALLYAGVLLLTGGVGALIAQHQQDIGPLAIAL